MSSINVPVPKRKGSLRNKPSHTEDACLCFLRILEAGSPRSRCQHSWVLVRASFGRRLCRRVLRWGKAKGILCLICKGTDSKASPPTTITCRVACAVMSDSLGPHGLQPTRLLCPWHFPRQQYWSGLPFPTPTFGVRV